MTAAVIGSLRVQLGLDSAQFEQGLEKASQKSREQGLRIGRVLEAALGFSLANITGRVTAAVTQSVVELNKLGAAFDDSMRRLGAAADIPTKQLAAIQGDIRRIGLETKEGAKKTADTVKELVKSGVSIEDAMDGAVKNVIMLAQANEAELAESTQVAAQAMLLFNMRGNQMGEVAQAVTGYVAYTKAEVNDFALAMAQGGSAAVSAGLSLREFASVMAITTDRFTSGSDQGTSFKTFIQRLSAPTGEAAEKLREMGFSIFDTNGKLKSMQEIAEGLSVAISRYSNDQDRMNALTRIFGTDADRMAAALATNAHKFRQFNEVVVPGIDHMEKASQVMSGTEGSKKGLTSAIEEFGATLGDAGLTQAGIEFNNFLADMVENAARGVQTLTALGKAVGVLRRDYVPTGAEAVQNPGMPTEAQANSINAQYAKLMGLDRLVSKTGKPLPKIRSSLGEGGAAKEKVKLESAPMMKSFGGGWWSDYLDEAQDYDSVLESIAQTQKEINEMMMMDAVPPIIEIKTSWEEVGDAIVDAGRSTENLIGAFKRRDWLGVLENGIALLEKIGGLGDLFGGSSSKGGGKMGSIGKIFSGVGKLLGFANGGSFEVAGASGVDRNLVAFRATAGERVTVTKPNQSPGGGSFVYSPQIDARGADAAAVQRIEQVLEAQAASFSTNVIGVVRDGFQRRAFRGY